MARTVQKENFISAVLKAARNGGGKNFCLQARAGTGKTSAVVDLVDDYTAEFKSHEVTVCAYNKAAADELKVRLEKLGVDWKKLNAATVHSLGFGLVRFAFKGVAVKQFKVRDLIEAQNAPVYREFTGAIEQLVGLAKIEGFGFFPDCNVGDASAWYKIADHYDVNGFDDTSSMDAVVQAAQHIYTLSLEQTDVIDFDDMILFPLVKKLRVRFQKDLLIVDEAQDTGRARQALLRKFVKPTGIMLVVGDDRQGIYAFAGAQADALDQLIEGLGAQVFPLTVCWRCPKAVIREAQKLVPDIEWAPDAAEGSVSAAEQMPDKMEATDAILCRNTAPLIVQAYALLRKGIACRVEGREIGTGLVKMVNRWKTAKTIDKFLVRLEDYKEREVQNALAKKNEAKAEEVRDRCETLVHLCNVCLEKKQSSLARPSGFHRVDVLGRRQKVGRRDLGDLPSLEGPRVAAGVPGRARQTLPQPMGQAGMAAAAGSQLGLCRDHAGSAAARVRRMIWNSAPNTVRCDV